MKTKKNLRSLLAAALFLGVFLCGASSLHARTTYEIFVHGLHPLNHCQTRNANWGKTDPNDYWLGLVPTSSTRRFVGFNTNAAGGAFGAGACAAQGELQYAMDTFCLNDDCKIYTHSTGGLVMSYWLDQQQSISWWQRKSYRIKQIRLMANASGGSEWADSFKWLSYDYDKQTSWDNMGYSTVLDSVRIPVARSKYDHNRTNGYTMQLTSGTGKITGASHVARLASVWMRGENDSIVSNHSLCGMRFVGDYEKCTSGTATVQYDMASLVCADGWLFNQQGKNTCEGLDANTWAWLRWATKWDNHSVFSPSVNDGHNHMASMVEYLDTAAAQNEVLQNANFIAGTVTHSYNSDGGLRRLLTNYENTWEQISGKLKQISVGDGGEVWGVNSANDIYRYNGNQTWTQIAGKLKHVSVGQNGVVWGIGPSDTIHRYNGNNTWTTISGSLKQVDVGPLGEVWGVNSSNNIFRYNGNNTWTQVTGASLKYVSVGESGVVFGVAPDGKIYRSNGTNTWALIAGNLKQIDFGPDLAIWGVNSADQIFRYEGGGAWTQMPGLLKHISIGPEGHRWGVNSSDNVYHMITN